MLKKLISFRTKYDIRLWQQKNKPWSYFKNTTIDTAKNQVYIFLAADYGNLGDVAITFAQTKFLETNSDYQVIEVPISQSLEGLWFVKANIKPGDIVTTVGGGNMGELYDQIEYIRQLVFKFFPNNRIISFPQTFDFTDTTQGRKALEKAQKYYSIPQDLTLVAREKISYELMKKSFPQARVLVTPDIVLSLDESKPKTKRKGALICLRNDKEKSLSEQQNTYIIEQVNAKYDQVQFYDTHIGGSNLPLTTRNRELNKIWTAFREAELVITDRLHGMIFCYITQTPCIVFQNNNHKVLGTFDWIKDNQFVRLMKEFDKKTFEEYLNSQDLNTEFQTDLSSHYNEIRELLK